MANAAAKELLKAINFVMPVQKNKGTPQQQFCLIANGWIVAADEYMCIASPIEMEIEACPSTYQLKAALLKSKEDLSFTKIDNSTLTVRSGNLKATVACCNPNILNLQAPDDLRYPVDDSFKAAIKAAEPLCEENTNRPELGAIKIADACCYGAHPAGKAVLQAYHGFEIPGAYLVPKAAAKAVSAAKISLTGIGLSNSTMTFHFENGAFIKTALHSGNFPGIEHLFETELKEKVLIPEDFFHGLNAITPFAKEGYVHFEENCITSDSVENAASTYSLPEFNLRGTLDISLINKVKSNLKEVIFDQHKVVFFGDIARGVIAKVAKNNA